MRRIVFAAVAAAFPDFDDHPAAFFVHPDRHGCRRRSRAQARKRDLTHAKGRCADVRVDFHVRLQLERYRNACPSLDFIRFVLDCGRQSPIVEKTGPQFRRNAFGSIDRSLKSL